MTTKRKTKPRKPQPKRKVQRRKPVTVAPFEFDFSEQIAQVVAERDARNSFASEWDALFGDLVNAVDQSTQELRVERAKSMLPEVTP